MIAVLLAFTAYAGPLSDGVVAFDKGDIPGAIAAWEPAVENGWGSGRLKYNLGNAYYRRGDLPRAIAYWRAAAQLRPRSNAVTDNLALARGELERVPTPAAAGAFWMRILTPGELGLLGSLLVLLGSMGLIWRARRREGSRVPWVGFGLLGWVLGILSVMGWWEQTKLPFAVVVDRPAVCRESPNLEAAQRLVLQPGAELRVVQTAGSFLLVETGDGDRGWVTDGAVFRVPR